jgi:hypothetical protein
MAEPTSDALDKDLQDSGYRRDSHDPPGQYYTTKNGRTEIRYTDGDHSRDRDDPHWQKHQNGDQY